MHPRRSASYHHHNAADHHEAAAHHHRKAAKHHAAGDTERAAHHAHAARGHALFANESANHASKQHARTEGDYFRSDKDDYEDNESSERKERVGKSGYGRGEQDWRAGNNDYLDEEREEDESSRSPMRGIKMATGEDEETGSPQNGHAHHAPSSGSRRSSRQMKGRPPRGGSRSHAA